MKILKLALISLSLSAGYSANAGLLLEPFMSYESSVTVADFGLDYGGKTTGVGIGARVGYTLPVLFWLALDYSLLNDATFEPAITGNSAKTSRSDLYLSAGFNFPILVRAWFGYGLQNTATLKDDDGNTEFSGGTNYKIGAGFTGLPIVSINLEYFKNDFKEVKSGATTTQLSTADSFSDTGVRLGVSAPFDL